MTRDKVVFRTWGKTNGGGVIALFPYDIVDDRGHCNSYEHIGQHGGANYGHVLRATRPAKPAEYRALAKELTSRGYNLQVIKRRAFVPANWEG